MEGTSNRNVWKLQLLTWRPERPNATNLLRFVSNDSCKACRHFALSSCAGSRNRPCWASRKSRNRKQFQHMAPVRYQNKTNNVSDVMFSQKCVLRLHISRTGQDNTYYGKKVPKLWRMLPPASFLWRMGSTSLQNFGTHTECSFYHHLA